MSDDATMWETLNCLPDAVEHMIHGDPEEADSVKASDAVRWAIAEIARLREERRWVPVRERLPEEGVDVLVMVNGRCHVAGFETFENGYVHWTLASFESVTPTHWMPLPTGPEGDE